MIFLPFLAPGHMLPMVDMARLFSSHGVTVTIITTTFNAAQFLKAIDKDINSGHKIAIHTVELPSEETTLPQGTENFTTISSLAMAGNLFRAMTKLQPQIEQFIKERSPHCIVSDMYFPWTVDLALSLGIPRLVFHGCSYFALCCMDTIKRYAPHTKVTGEAQSFLIPGLPDEIEIMASQLPDYVRTPGGYTLLLDHIREADKRSFGVLVNSFYELETAYADHYTNVTGNKAWHIGPLHQSIKRDTADKAERGNEVHVVEHGCLTWLNCKKPNSVLYVSFGSLTHFTSAQLLEIAFGLEASGYPFIWVVRKEETMPLEGDEMWLPEGFEERMMENEMGLIIRGWAPQMLILEHPSIGGFVTHCGWNSTLESVTAGVPMITWPLAAEQFYNEKLISKVLKIGAEVGVEEWHPLIQAHGYLVTRKKIEKAVTQLMGVNEEAKERRKRTEELGEMAKRAVEEGGSSHVNITSLLNKLRLMQCHVQPVG
ncbi:hypothetical protein IFM89_003658 [Coptis chinensis]|uniref:Glycosyltransferase n=1 Tax=Coptis chinensis TaxID=261450 RepID=A0A835HJG2_9MAGN|nr:hypothetical protein IFM89_003658 [Coptis chinensis]